MKTTTLTAKQTNDNTLGLISVFKPAIEKLNQGSRDEKRLAEILNEFQNLVADVRASDWKWKRFKDIENDLSEYYTKDDLIEAENNWRMTNRSKSHSQLELIKLISNL